MNYQTANSLLQGRCKKSRKIGNNTYLKRRGDHISILYHNTDIIDYYPHKVVLRNGGWHTKTTKERLNEYSPVIIYQNNFEWYVVSPTNGVMNWDNPVLFKNNMAFDYNGQERINR